VLDPPEACKVSFLPRLFPFLCSCVCGLWSLASMRDNLSSSTQRSCHRECFLRKRRLYNDQHFCCAAHTFGLSPSLLTACTHATCTSSCVSLERIKLTLLECSSVDMRRFEPLYTDAARVLETHFARVAVSAQRIRPAHRSNKKQHSMHPALDFSPFLDACEALASMRDVIAPLIAARVLETHLRV